MPFKNIEDKRAADRRYRRRRRADERRKGQSSPEPWEAVRPTNETEQNSRSAFWWVVSGIGLLLAPGLLGLRSR